MSDANAGAILVAPDSGTTPLVMAFVADRNSEGVIRQCLSDLAVPATEFIDGNVDKAIAELGHRRSPRLLIVDISGAKDPAGQINKLAELCSPGTSAVVIGESNDITLYRALKDAGVVEYYFKPLVSTLVTRTCNAVLTGNLERAPARTGKLVFVLGVRGGAGATTVAVNTAWHLAEQLQRRVMLVDLDLHSGDTALQLDAKPSHALYEALQHPDRVDDLFLERGLIQVTDRLHLLASLEPFGSLAPLDENAVLAVVGNLLHRYRYVIVDMPPVLSPALMHVFHLPSTCLLVSDSSLASARDVARWREAIGPNTPERSTLHILNKSGAEGALPEREFDRVSGQPPDVVIRYDREIVSNANLGIRNGRKCPTLQQGLARVLRTLSGEQTEPSRSLLGRLFG